MCDEQTFREREEYLNKLRISRREFGQGAAGVALMVMLPPVANALDVVEHYPTIEMPDGTADCYFVHPSNGAHAGVMLWPDARGIRGAMRMMGKRMAESGYSVLVINHYYRTVQGQPFPDDVNLPREQMREVIQKNQAPLSNDTCVSDGEALVGFLDQQPAVDSRRKIGVMGYCMTGSYTFRLSAAIPDRVGAGASFHGGGLVTDADDSPHLLIPRIEGGMLVAIAEQDEEKAPHAEQLEAAFDNAGVRGEVEVYEGTSHGWCPPDAHVYDEAQSEKAWSRCLALFEHELSA